MSAKSSPSEIIEPVVSAQTAMVYVMVVAAVADGDLKEDEVKTIADLVDMLPVFKDLTGETARGAISTCTDLLENEDGLDEVLSIIDHALPGQLTETAYALACDVVAADGVATQEELRWLEMLRDKLNVSRLHAAAIEWGTRVRFAHE
ncbi:tellurite resistance TerB family protein [Marinibaculum pumilum]|uniref:Tellurite resistance TerB family protein n=1 Tax=Marinibaculum pumilum TaxID=1766165 RepID=A0ABV7L2R8_9PROT